MFLPSGLSFLSAGITGLCHHTQLTRTLPVTGSWKRLAKGLVELRRGGGCPRLQPSPMTPLEFRDTSCAISVLAGVKRNEKIYEQRNR